MNKPKVLITGASGLIGGITFGNLSHKYEFTALNRSYVSEIPTLQADITDLDSIMPAFENIDIVLHMSNYTKDVINWDEHFNVGILGTRNVYEASRLNGVKRVVLGSTGDTMTGYEMEYPYGELAAGEYDKVKDPWQMITEEHPTRPKSIYGACKVFCEALGHFYSDRYDISVLCIRLGGVLAEDKPNLRRQYPGFLSQQDCLQMIDLCLSAPESIRFDVFHASSNNKYAWRDTSRAKDILGWNPIGSSDNHSIDDKGGWHQVLEGDQKLNRIPGMKKEII